MLAYEYMCKALTQSKWAQEKKKKSKFYQTGDKMYTYVDITIPIISGAIAGMLIYCRSSEFKKKEI